MSDPSDHRRYSDDEVKEILQKAVERSSSRSLARREGTSLAELKAIAAEVGIDPGQVEEAARSVTRRPAGRPHPILGGPILLNVERTVPGTISEEETPRVLSAIRGNLGVHGEASEIHGSLEWAGRGELSERHVAIASRDGMTTGQGSANLSGVATVTYLPAGIIGTLLTVISMVGAVDAGNAVWMAATLTILPTLYTIQRSILGAVSRSQTQRLEDAVEEVARLASVEPDVSPAPADPVPGASDPRD
jgi:hypothetical protein